MLGKLRCTCTQEFQQTGHIFIPSRVSVRPLEAGWTRGGVTGVFTRRPPARFRLSALTLAVCELLWSLGTGAGRESRSCYLLCFLDPGLSAVEAELRAFSIFCSEDWEGAGPGQPSGVRHSVDGRQFEESTPIHLSLTPLSVFTNRGNAGQLFPNALQQFRQGF